MGRRQKWENAAGKMIALFFVLLFVKISLEYNCDVSQRFDCGFVGITEKVCVDKGCCWRPVEGGNHIPWCYFPQGPNDCFVSKTNLSTIPFNETETQIISAYFFEKLDISGKGGVSYSPNKYYHWMRIGALSMKTLMTISDYQKYDPIMKDYVKWVLVVQNEVDPYGDVRTNPIFTLPNGEVYSETHFKPQTDGVALRVLSLIYYANNLLISGEVHYVKENLWTNETSKYHGGAIKFDLDWIASNWQQQSWDIWEGVSSSDFFFNRMAMKISLLKGSEFATRMGDLESAMTYTQAALDVNTTLKYHFNGNFIYQSKNRQKDASVIIAVNRFFWDREGFKSFSPTSMEVSRTVRVLHQMFCQIFPVNQKDLIDEVPGIFYGRFSGDTENPWVVTTAAIGELFYRIATHFLSEGFSKSEWIEWKEVIPGLENCSNSICVANSIMKAGDAIMERIHHHMKGKFVLSEQFGRKNGERKGIEDCTWSYSSILDALWIRKGLKEKIKLL